MKVIIADLLNSYRDCEENNFLKKANRQQKQK